MNTAALLNEVTRRGIKLEPDGDALCYTAPKDVLTPELMAELKAHKTELLGILRSESPPTRGIYEYRLTDSPSWLVFLAPPGADLDDAWQALEAHFGEDRLVEVRPKHEATGDADAN